MTGIEPVLAEIGINVASDAVWRTLQEIFQEKNPTRDELAQDLQSEVPELSIKGAEAIADSAIDMLAEQGELEVTDSRLYAKESFTIASEPWTEFRVSGSTTETEKSKIDVSEGTEIVGKGAKIEQDEDGNISFYT